jgi:hypothetical protein
MENKPVLDIWKGKYIKDEFIDLKSLEQAEKLLNQEWCSKESVDSREKYYQDLIVPLLDELIETTNNTARSHSDGKYRGEAQDRVYELQKIKKEVLK